MISNRDLWGLPDITQLRDISQSLAMLEAIIKSEWALRYFLFRRHPRGLGEAKTIGDPIHEIALMLGSEE